MTRTAPEAPRTRPAESSACAATYAYLCARVAEVSNPSAGIIARAVSDPAWAPASNLHEATSVAPFQLACTIVSSPVVLRLASTAGGVSGRALQGKRKAR